MSKKAVYGFCLAYFDPKLSFLDKVKSSMQDYQNKFHVVPQEVHVNYYQYSEFIKVQADKENLDNLPIKVVPDISVILNNFLVYANLNE